MQSEFNFSKLRVNLILNSFKDKVERDIFPSQNIGVNDVEKLKKFEEIKDRNNPTEIADLAIEVEMPNVQSKKANNKLPNFYGPCKALFAEMKDVIQKYVNPDNKAILLPLIRSTIKKRLVVVLKGKKFMVVQDILQLYRATYPTTTDEQMLQSLVATISQSCWPKTGKKDDGQQRETETIATGKFCICIPVSPSVYNYFS